MTEYTLRTSYGCPVSLMADANELMYLCGFGPGDKLTFRMPKDEDGNDAPIEDPDNPGQFYVLASGQYRQDWVAQITQDVLAMPLPDWIESEADVDRVAAKRAQDSFELLPDESEPTSGGILKDPLGLELAIKVKLQGYEAPPAPIGDPVLGPLQTQSGITYWIDTDAWTIGFNIDQDPDPDVFVPALQLLRRKNVSVQNRLDMLRRLVLAGWRP